MAKCIIRQHKRPFLQEKANVSGEIILNDNLDLLQCDEKTLRKVRRQTIGTISQESLSGLNPLMTVGRQISEALKTSIPSMPDHDVKSQVIELIESIGLTPAEKLYKRFPHQLSGGQRQRVMIAIAAIRKPELLIADEPTTALDVTVQATILRLIRTIQSQYDMTVLFITHDLGVVAQIADRVAVMYAGELVEIADVHSLFSAPKHPYTKGLLASMPGGTNEELRLKGYVSDLNNLPSGCAFAPRCPNATELCQTQPPEQLVGDSKYRCWRESE
ncbi:oligopeptide transport ATP-binding protein OppD [Vibrio astriarenae]|nr:oligopeptide transport ATP-binding protein OppD [Vibrio sp. C7]